MGKNENVKLGRSLLKQKKNPATQEKSRIYNKQNRNVLESATEVTDIEQTEEFERIFASQNPIANVFNLDKDLRSRMTVEDMKKEESVHESSLRVPRRYFIFCDQHLFRVGYLKNEIPFRPEWHATMSADELDANEKESFLVWRRNLARLEENEKLVLTPFEKNLDIWRQLWRVLERSDLIVMVVDARDPLFYRSPDLENYAREIDRHKKTLLLINKADLLPIPIREEWAQYFRKKNTLFLFWSAKAATATLEGKQLKNPEHRQNVLHNKESKTKLYGRDELLARLQAEAECIVKTREMEKSAEENMLDEHGRKWGQRSKHAVVGFVGYPNVGKSSTMNALVGGKKTGVTSTPGKTKHFQTLIVSGELMLCDCPGLVFPTFSSSRHEMIASGVLPLHRMTEHRGAVQIVADRVPRYVIEEIYNIRLPKPKPYEPQSRPPLAAELLRAYCASRGWVASSGLPNETKAARLILKDYIDGKLPHFELPPAYSAGETPVSIGDVYDASQSSLGGDHAHDACDDKNSPSGVACTRSDVSDELLQR